MSEIKLLKVSIEEDRQAESEQFIRNLIYRLLLNELNVDLSIQAILLEDEGTKT
ncbi:hypothetical protein [Terribacillus saccharophilus]|uniref:hypothetical protein n=1 Tax=Terribacillus saccharophilus TaxID=361277 RepID=UPI001595E691|nr:hypothetical protein [Terribacillus saccharophilus]